MKVKEKAILAGVFIIAVSLLLYAFFNPNGVLTLIQKKQDMYYIRFKNQELEQQNNALKKKIERVKKDQEYVDVLIRENLEMIKKGEVLIKFVKPEQAGGGK